MNKIINIDFNNDKHMKAVMKLSERNNFHIMDIHMYCGDVEIIKKNIEKIYYEHMALKQPMEKQEYNNKINILKKKAYKFDPKYKGFIISKGKKAVGFILCHINNRIDINFLLIDKKYQKMGLGTNLIDHIKNKYENYLIVVRSDNDNSNCWYIRNNFITTEQFVSKFIEKYPNPKDAPYKASFIFGNLMADMMNKVNQTRLYFIHNI